MPKQINTAKTLPNSSAKDAWKRPFKNAKKLLWGEVGKSLFTLGTLALTARTLGVADFGALAILTTTLAIITQFVTFSSWQMVLSYGAQAFKESNAKAYQDIVGFALFLELVMSCAGFLILFLLSDYLVGLFQLSEAVAPILPWLGLLFIPSAVSGIADGTLRLTDRFSVISVMNVVPKFIKFLIVCYLFWIKAGLDIFIYSMFFTTTFNSLMRLGFAWHYFKKDIKTLNTQAADKIIEPWEKGKLYAPKQGAWKFAFGLYTDSCLGMGTQQLGTLFLGALVGPTGAGLYRIAEKISTIVASPVNKLMMPAVFTDMAHLNAQKNYKAVRHMVFKLGTAMGGAALVVLMILAVTGKPLLALFAGPEFVAAYGTMLVLVLNIVLWSTTFTLYPLIMTSGKVRYIIYGRSVMFVTYVGLMFPLINMYGSIGAAWSAVISSGIATIISAYGAARFAGLGLEKPKKA